MESRMPKQGEIYKHFKGNNYQIVTLATHSETMEKMVVYKALYGEYATFVRPMDMFTSKVDREKYPDVEQENRFELVINEELPDQNSLLLRFLEAENKEEKITILQHSKIEINDELLSLIAQSLDFVESEDTLELRYESIVKYLKTLVKYESMRLR
ncbi:MAG: DUF1653 domain-containing protein [Lachnospiraceae bacterium]|nr:DUF1653 domain-containing protein [Lachnospiraceae bacterium]